MDMTDRVELRVRVTGAPRPVPPRTITVPRGSSLRDVLRQLSMPVEGSALWLDGEPVPSDRPVERSGELEIVSTFSGG
jgi:sulfur carrier protein ThiS